MRVSNKDGVATLKTAHSLMDAHQRLMGNIFKTAESRHGASKVYRLFLKTFKPVDGVGAGDLFMLKTPPPWGDIRW